jgi:hypothetical protein
MNRSLGRRVIAWKCLPTRIPLNSCLLFWLLLDRIQPPSWLWFCFWAITVIFWSFFIYGSLTEVDVDILSTRKTEK